MAKIPENFFESHTPPFVVLRTFSFGTTKFGYGSTLPEALQDSAAAEWGESTLKVFRRTEETKRLKDTVWQVYEEVPARSGSGNGALS